MIMMITRIALALFALLFAGCHSAAPFILGVGSAYWLQRKISQRSLLATNQPQTSI